MKKLILLIQLIVFIALSNGQSYYPFPDSNAIWNEFITDVNPPYVVFNNIDPSDTLISLNNYIFTLCPVLHAAK